MPYADKEKKKAWEEAHRKGKLHKIWWGYLYEDSSPDDFLERMSTSGHEILAMKHDRDVTAAGEVKEQHWHVVVRFAHATSAKVAKELLCGFGVKAASVQYRDSWTAVARYLCHMDDPNKTQYDPSEVMEFGGADYLTAIKRTADKYHTTAEMMRWVQETDCRSFAALLDWAMEENLEWFMALCDSSAVIMREYIKARRYDTAEQEATRKALRLGKKLSEGA